MNITRQQREAIALVQRYKEDYRTFAADTLKIRSKDGGIIPFVFNRAQNRVWDIVQKKMSDGLPVRLYLLKARQLGMSTWAEGLLFWRLMHQPYTDGLVVAHENDSAQKILSMLQLMWSELPEYLRPIRKISNKREVVFANPRYPEDGSNNPGLHSRAVIATADNRNFGIGSTLQVAHLSEFSRYPQVNAGIKEAMKTFRQAVPRKPNTFVIYETTARGFNYAKDVWDDEHNGIEKIFLSWIGDDAYTSDEPLPEEDIQSAEMDRYGNERDVRQQVVQQLDFWYPEVQDDRWTAYESLKRLRWRREQIDEEFDGDKMLFRQEHPTYPEEAFLTSGTTVFDAPRLHAIKDSLVRARTVPQLYKFDKKRHDFESNIRLGDLRVYEQPQPGRNYVIGADVGEGYTHADASAAQILRLPDMAQVAVGHLRIDPDDFAAFLAAVGKIYNDAWIAVESVGIGLSTQLALSKVQRYPKMYRREVWDTATNKYQNKYGWNTNSKSKPLMISDLKAAIRDDEIRISDIPTINELLKYVQLETGANRMGPIDGAHDDLVISLALAWQMMLQIGGNVVTDNASVDPECGYPVNSFLWWESKILEDSATQHGHVGI